jgi:hypothetical protein
VLADDERYTATEVEPRIARLAVMHHSLTFEDRPVDQPDAEKRGMPPKVRALATVFVAAVLTFVVSLSAAVGLQLTPDHKTSTAAAREMANASAEPTMAPRAVPPAPAAPPAPEALPAGPAAEPVVVSPPEAPPLVEAPDAAQMRVPEAVPPVVDAPDAAPDFEGPDAPPAFVPPAPGYVSPPATEPLPPKHPILSRIPIINRIPGVRGPADQPQVQQEPGVLYPPPVPPQ